MAAITPVNDTPIGYRGALRASGTGTANQTDTLTTPSQTFNQKLSYVTVSYSAAPTQTGVLIEIDSGLGAGYDTTLFTGTANAQDTYYVPDHDSMVLFPNDAIRVTAPQAGGVITAAIVIVTEPA